MKRFGLGMLGLLGALAVTGYALHKTITLRLVDRLVERNMASSLRTSFRRAPRGALRCSFRCMVLR